MGYHGKNSSYNPYMQKNGTGSSINAADSKAKEIITSLHKTLISLNPNKDLNSICFQNCLLTIILKAPEKSPRDYAVIMEQEYGFNASFYKIIDALKAFYMNTPSDRATLVQWASITVDSFFDVLKGSTNKYDEFKEKLNAVPVAKAFGIKERMFILAFFTFHEELDFYSDIDILLKSGNKEFMSLVFNRLMECVEKSYNLLPYKAKSTPDIQKRQISDDVVKQQCIPIVPIDINSPAISQIISETHESFSEWNQADEKSIYLFENRLLDTVCGAENGGPGLLATMFSQKYDKYIEAPYVAERLKRLHIGIPAERYNLIIWAKHVDSLFAGAIQGNRKQYDSLVQKLREGVSPKQERPYCLERVAVIMIYHNHPELDAFHDMESLFKIGTNVLVKNYLNNLLDALCKVYNFPVFSMKVKTNASGTQVSQKPGLTLEQAISQVEQMSIKLERTNAMLKELQDEFQQQLEESKVTVLTDFFAKLNSDRYGNILDMVLQLRKGVTRLAKEGYELPEDLNGLFVMYNKLVQFIRDSHIDPIRKPGSQADVTASDIEFCDYEGTPFVSEDETKLVETVSPGWVYKDQNVQISRPKVKEIVMEEDPNSAETPVVEEKQTLVEVPAEGTPDFVEVPVVEEKQPLVEVPAEEDPDSAEAPVVEEKQALVEDPAEEGPDSAEAPVVEEKQALNEDPVEEESDSAEAPVVEEKQALVEVSTEEELDSVEVPVLNEEPTPNETAVMEEPSPAEVSSNNEESASAENSAPNEQTALTETVDERWANEV